MAPMSIRKRNRWGVLASSLAVLSFTLLSGGPGRAASCLEPAWSSLQAAPQQLCTLLLLEDPPMARSDCASQFIFKNLGADHEFHVAGIGAARYRIIDSASHPEPAADIMQSAATCYADPACMTDPDGAIADTLTAVAHDADAAIRSEASIDLRKIVANSASELFGNTDDIAPPSARLVLVRVGTARVLVLQTSLGLFDTAMSGPVSVAVLRPEVETALCPE